MASTALKQTKDGRSFYEIRIRPSRSRPTITKRWYPPEGWSQRAIDRELAKVAAEYERQAKAGELLSLQEQKAADEAAAKEAEKIQTLKQYGERVFMPAKAITCSEHSRANFQQQLDKHIYPVLVDIKLPEISPADISALLLQKQKEGYAHASVIKMFTVLSLLMKEAYLADLISRNPMDKVARPKPRKDEEKGKTAEAFSAEELRDILKKVDREPLKWRALTWLLAVTGIRVGEACGLQWSFVDFVNNRITIAHTLGYTKVKGIYLDTPKSGKTRTLDVDPNVMKLLRALRLEQASNAISQYVFTQEKSSKPMHPQTPTRYFKKFGDKNGIKKFHPHMLRHTFASVAITAGADIASVSEVLGHSDKAVTLRMYTHADDESRKRASSIVWDSLKEPPSKSAPA